MDRNRIRQLLGEQDGIEGLLTVHVPIGEGWYRRVCCEHQESLTVEWRAQIGLLVVPVTMQMRIKTLSTARAEPVEVNHTRKVVLSIEKKTLSKTSISGIKTRPGVGAIAYSQSMVQLQTIPIFSFLFALSFSLSFGFVLICHRTAAYISILWGGIGGVFLPIFWFIFPFPFILCFLK